MNHDLTEHLQRWSESGDRRALDQLLPMVYSELSRIATGYMKRERVNHTLQTSALVHEAYLKLVDQDRMKWQDRGHFYAVAARIMRRLLVDHARGRDRAKRGGNEIVLSLDEGLSAEPQQAPAVRELDRALVELERLDPDLAQVVELRFFGGLENREIAQLHGVSERPIIRRWRTAQAWLFRYLTRGHN